MTAAQQVGTPVDYHQKWAFRLELEGVVVGGFESCGPLSQESEMVEQHEGGSRTAVDKRNGKFKTENVKAKRGSSNDMSLWLWWRNVKAGIHDIRSGCVVALNPAGDEICRYPMERVGLLKLTADDFDAKAGAENSIEEAEFFLIDFDKQPQ